MFKKLIYGVGLCFVIVSLFFVLKNTASAQFSEYRVKSSVYAVKETPDIMPAYVQGPAYDVYRDDSIQKYVGRGVFFDALAYVPSDLAPIHSNFTANDSKKYFLRQEATTQFADMAWHFWNDFGGDKIWITSAYRSNAFQKYMLGLGCPPIRCAQPGSSEHQAGLAIDMKIMTKRGGMLSLYTGNTYHTWFANNAHKRGFHNSYQKGVEIDGYRPEGWHWRYLGVELATKLHDEGITFTEYYKQLNIDHGQGIVHGSMEMDVEIGG